MKNYHIPKPDLVVACVGHEFPLEVLAHLPPDQQSFGIQIFLSPRLVVILSSKDRLLYYLPIAGGKIVFVMFLKRPVKCQQLLSGFELWLLSPFPTMITVTPRTLSGFLRKN